MTSTDQPLDDRLARLYLSQKIEPGTSLHLHRMVQLGGPIQAIQAMPENVRTGDLAAAAEVLARAGRYGARFVIPEDDEWPAGLPVGLTAEDLPPLGLWVRGDVRLDEALAKSVAVIGSRASTAYGEHVAGELGHGLSDSGWTVVAGGAYGIDAAAHRGALAAVGAPTVAVLACGVDRVYPSAHSTLFARIVEQGGLLVSEYSLGAAPLKHRFLSRNRLIASLTRGMVVVESTLRSGTGQAARRAKAIGRPLMAVPGPVTSAMSVGNHELLAEGATLVSGAKDVIATVVGRTLPGPQPAPEPGRLPPLTTELARAERLAANELEARQIIGTVDNPTSGNLIDAIAEALMRAEERGEHVPRHVPELVHVYEVPDGDLVGAPTHGLRCPHCGSTAWAGYDSGVYVIDQSTRWSRFGLEVTDSADEGPQTPYQLVGSYGDSEHHGIGYACENCARAVALPDDIEEVGSD